MRRRVLPVAVVLATLGIVLALRARSAPPDFAKLLAAYPVRKVWATTGAVMQAGGEWQQERVRTYATDLRMGTLVDRLDTDLRSLGMARRDRTTSPVWRSEDGALQIRILAKNPCPWAAPDPKSTLYLEIWEPRAVPFPERIDDWWLRANRAVGIRRPAFWPIPIRLVPASPPP